MFTFKRAVCRHTSECLVHYCIVTSTYSDDQKQNLKSLIADEAEAKQALTDLEESWLIDQEELEQLSTAFESEE